METMKNRINFHADKFSATDDKKWLPQCYRGIFLMKAEEDYVACRALFMLNLTSTAYYHLHQSIEKYLKAFILDRGIDYHISKCKEQHSAGTGIDNSILCRCLMGHKLEKWAKLCGLDDEFFLDTQLIADLTVLSHLVEVPRYPQDKVQSWGGSPISLIHFLDEFVFEMRTRIRHVQYEDVIQKFLDGYISVHPSLSYEYNKSMTPAQIQQFIACENESFGVVGRKDHEST
jgi:hypothetical protein